MVEKVKPVGFIAGLILLVLAAVMIYLSVKGLLTIPSADSYQDNGTHTFESYQVVPVQVQNTSAYSRDRRMNPTKTVYMVYYRATDGSGYQWTDRAITRELGQETVKEGVPFQTDCKISYWDKAILPVLIFLNKSGKSFLSPL